MAASPHIVLKPEAYGHRRVGNLLNKLKIKSIDCCAVLRKMWEKNPRMLYLEVWDWFQKGFQKQFEEVWIKEMLCEVLLEPSERFPKRVKRVFFFGFRSGICYCY